MSLELKAKLSLDNRPFTQGMNFSKQQVAAWSRVVQQQQKDAASKSSAAWGTAWGLITAGAVAAGAAVKKALEFGGQIQDASDKLGIPAEKLQAWKFEAERSGSSLEEVSATFVRLAVNADKALNESGPEADAMADAFERLGLSMEKLEGTTLEQKMEALQEHIKGAKVDGELLADVVKTLGKNGASLIPVFKSGKFGTGKGLANSDADIAALDEIGDRLSGVATFFGQGLRKAAAKLLIPIRVLTAGGTDGRSGSLGGSGEQLTQSQREAAMLAGEKSGASEAEQRKAQEIRENMAQVEAARAEQEQKLQGDVVKSGRDLAYSRLKTDKERKAMLEQELADLIKEAGNFSTPGARERAFKAQAEANKKQQDIEDLTKRSREAEGKIAGELTPSDSLRSIGNYLGSRDDRPLEELRGMNQKLQRLLEKRVTVEI